MKRKPTSPGEILSEEFLKPLGISQKELAAHLHCDYKVVNRIVNEKASVTPEMAVKLAAQHSIQRLIFGLMLKWP
jgi:addiction module HigA family antidote